MPHLKAAGKFIFNVVIFFGALACVLEYLKINPEELHVGVTLPHSGWLVAAILLFAAGLSSSGWSLYGTLRPRALPVVERMACEQAVLLELFSDQAAVLSEELEALWHHWDNEGEKLIHPIGKQADLKDWTGSKAIQLVDEWKGFCHQYCWHLASLRSQVPAFKSEITELKYPSEREYHLLLADLKAHAKSLDHSAQYVRKAKTVL